MNANEALTAARRFARRLNYSPGTVRVVFDARRRYGCALVRRVEARRKGGKYRRAETWIAVPASWGEPAEPVEWRPAVDVVRQDANESEHRRGRRYYRLTRFNGHRFSYRVAYKHDRGEQDLELVAKFLREGTLRLDLSGRFGAGCKPSEVDRELLALQAKLALT